MFGTGVKIDYQAKQLIYNVHSYLKKRKMCTESDEYIYDVNINQKVSKMTGLSMHTISNILRESRTMMFEEGVVDFKPDELKHNSKRKNAKRNYTKRLILSDLTQAKIKKQVMKYLMDKGHPPTLKVLNNLLKEENILQCSYEYLRQMLPKIGFLKADSSTLGQLNELPDITSARKAYLHAMKYYRDRNKNMFFLNDTKRWVVIRDYIAPKDMPNLIIVHISGSPGFLDKSKLMFKTKPTSNEDEEIFEEYENYDWMKDVVLPNLPAKSVIVTNIPYLETPESILLEEKPTSNSPRTFMESWLKSHNITFEDNTPEEELIELINSQESRIEFSLTKIIKDRGHDMLHLPEYHADLNVGLVMWENVNEQIDKQKSSATELLLNYSNENWQKSFQFVKDSEEEYIEFDEKYSSITSSSSSEVKVKEEADDNGTVSDGDTTSD